MAEIEFSILDRQCLNRRISDPKTLKEEIAAWETQRNRSNQTVDWLPDTKSVRENPLI